MFDVDKKHLKSLVDTMYLKTVLVNRHDIVGIDNLSKKLEIDLEFSPISNKTSEPAATEIQSIEQSDHAGAPKIQAVTPSPQAVTPSPQAAASRLQKAVSKHLAANLKLKVAATHQEPPHAAIIPVVQKSKPNTIQAVQNPIVPVGLSLLDTFHYVLKACKSSSPVNYPDFSAQNMLSGWNGHPGKPTHRVPGFNPGDAGSQSFSHAPLNANRPALKRPCESQVTVEKRHCDRSC